MRALSNSDVDCVLIVGGSPDRSSAKTICYAARGCAHIVAVDRGLDAVLDAGLSCDLFCGDADTVGERGLRLVEEAQSRIKAASFEVERYDPHKDATDLALALRAIEKRWPLAEIVCTCVSGGAPDHALGVLGRLAGARSSVRVIEDDFEARILHANDAWEICAAQGRRFSCIPVSVGAEVSEQGFCWNVDHAQMPLLSDWGISNVVESSRASVQCHEGVIACWLYC